MAVSLKRRLLAICAVCLLLEVDRTKASQEIVTKLTVGFMKALDECKKELSLPDHIMQDLKNFWREDYALVNKELGCAIICLASKFDLITDDMKVHHMNTHQFAKAHGADDELAKQLVTMIHECEKSFDDIVDNCSKTLEIAKCFRTKVHELKWAPSMETILEEIMTDIN